jgi:hypothetical protein
MPVCAPGRGEGRGTDAGVAREGPRGPEADLSRAKLAYERGDYLAAIRLLRPLLYPAALLSDEAQVLLAHKLLGLSCFFEKDAVCAEQEFNLLLSLRPDFSLDPVVEPLPAVAFVDSLRRKNEERLEQIRRRQAEEEARRRTEEAEQRRRAEEEARRRAPRVYVERVVERRFSPLQLVPLGIPQIVEGRRALGGVLLAGEVLTGAASLGSWLTVRLRYPNGTFPPRELTTAQALTATYLSTGAAFWGLCAAGLIEALLHTRTRVRVRELPGPPPELQQRRKAALRLVPGPMDGPRGAGDAAVGLTLGGRF